ncbi:MAG: hypothetical protein WDM76_13510 [Limisphaerales bacterium]
MSGTPIEPPPKLDANGNPIFEKGHDDDDDNAKSDKSADGIASWTPCKRNFCARFPPVPILNKFCLSADGTRIYIANEDVGAASILDATTRKNHHLRSRQPASRRAWALVLTRNFST